jgi:Rieske Fe-S protein
MRLNESLLDRRDFLDCMVGTGLVVWGSVAGEMVLSYLTGLEVPEPDQIIVGGNALATLEKERFVLVPYGPRPVMLLNLPDGELRALSAVCTHGQCNVRYRPDKNDIYCGCHKGRFTAEGVNVPGTPPPEPLQKYYVEKQDDGTLLVSNQPLDEEVEPESADSSDETVEG